MNAEKRFPSVWECSDIRFGRLIRRAYYGYTKREALATFRAYLKTLES